MKSYSTNPTLESDGSNCVEVTFPEELDQISAVSNMLFDDVDYNIPEVVCEFLGFEIQRIGKTHAGVTAVSLPSHGYYLVCGVLTSAVV
jgi:hypothetical protein